MIPGFGKVHSFIVHAPQSAGLSQHAARLLMHFGCTRVVQDWDGKAPVPHGALVLTNSPPPSLAGMASIDFTVLTLDAALARCKATEARLVFLSAERQPVLATAGG